MRCEEMIKFTVGDIFQSTAECIVNTVNCEGVMGKGLALEFKKRYPENYISYVTACKLGRLKIGKLHFFKEKGKLIVNFPTKDKWRNNSKMEYIQKGLVELVNLILAENIKSIAIPPLGCGNGNLDWREVKSVILEYLEPVAESRDIYIYEPMETFN